MSCANAVPLMTTQPRSHTPTPINTMPRRRANSVFLAGRAWPARGLTTGTAVPVGLTAYPGGRAGRAAGAPGYEMLGAPAATFPRTAETTGVPKAEGNAGSEPPTEFGVFPTGAE